MADRGMEKRRLEAREGEREREEGEKGKEARRQGKRREERRRKDKREERERGETREGGREETHTYTYLKVVVIQEQSGEVCEGPQLRTQVSDWSSYFQLCPMRSFRVITILSYHFAIQSS